MSVCVIVFLIGVFIAHALKVCVYLPLCDYDLCYFTRETRSGIAVFSFPLKFCKLKEKSARSHLPLSLILTLTLITPHKTDSV